MILPVFVSVCVERVKDDDVSVQSQLLYLYLYLYLYFYFHMFLYLYHRHYLHLYLYVWNQSRIMEMIILLPMFMIDHWHTLTIIIVNDSELGSTSKYRVRGEFLSFYKYLETSSQRSRKGAYFDANIAISKGDG